MKLSQKIGPMKKGGLVMKTLSFIALLVACITFSMPSHACEIGFWPDKVSTGPRSYALDVYAADFSFGATLDSSYINGTAAQNWSYSVNTSFTNVYGFSIFTLYPTAHPNLCMTEAGIGTVELEYCNGQLSQLWFYNGGFGTVNNIQSEMVSFGLLYDYNDVRCLDIYADGDNSGQPLDLAVCNGTYAQLVYPPVECAAGEPTIYLDNGDFLNYYSQI